MPPTIQTTLNTDRDKRPRTGEKRSELVCRVKYCNTLPDIPFDPKFVTYPFESNRFIQYNPTSLERNYRYEVLTEHDLGVTIDLINPETYATDPNIQLDPADEKLLEEDILTPQDTKRSRHHAKVVSWLRKPEYISTELTRYQPQTIDKVEAKVGHGIKKMFKDENLYMDRDSQIKAIEKTFEDVKDPIEKHYSKPSVVPVEILPVYPDFKLWKYPCAQVIFDSDPAPVGRSVPAQIEEMSQAMIRGVMDESGEQFVAYFLPTEDTLEKRRRDFENCEEYVDEEEYEYKMAREYNWNVKSKVSKGFEENYFFVVREEGVFYDELETRVRLSKRRQRAGQQPSNTRLVVKHRTLNAQEYRMQRYREKQLEPPAEEDEEEEEEEDEAEQKGEENQSEDEDERKKNNKGDKSDDERKSGSEDEGGKSDDERSGSEKHGNKSDSEKGSGKEDSDKESEKGENDEAKSNKSAESDADDRSHKSSSRSSSRSSSKSRSQSRSPSRSKSRSKSRSRSRSRSRSKSASRSPAGSAASSRASSRSGSASERSGSGSASGSGSDSEGEK